ncbi:IclR family transcriptional regulator [Gilliamella sp. B14448G11]|uniref:IclR family transcriptional regulator n=1 Tax=unclassified Gilliamella TaxID=2685620 RepID=UPI0018DD6C18|nr:MULTISPECIES: IclR family transcriptional regulator [unclassified Gilliamella]MBI0028205.1 IclR family transcriptional regulator [Gilliamella sp. B14448G7]MBI0034562.1 IclR family transcriptional regulator [Gilliamella sp. B14448G11]MBI0042058.1 IclR family transcriptional regulator [Gilliamella sp. B14448G12]
MIQKETTSAIDKAIAVLDVISNCAAGVTITEIIEATKLNKIIIKKILNTLLDREYVFLDEKSGKYTLGFKSLELGISSLVNVNIVDIAIPHVKSLSNTINETCFLGVYNSGNVVYLYKSEGNNAIHTSSNLGHMRPAYCTGLGRILLAHQSQDEIERILQSSLPQYTQKTITDSQQLNELLAKVRCENIAYDWEEVEEGLVCVASGIFNYSNEVVAALSIAGPSHRMHNQIEKCASLLKETTNLISKRLGYIST